MSAAGPRRVAVEQSSTHKTLGGAQRGEGFKNGAHQVCAPDAVAVQVSTPGTHLAATPAMRVPIDARHNSADEESTTPLASRKTVSRIPATDPKAALPARPLATMSIVEPTVVAVRGTAAPTPKVERKGVHFAPMTQTKAVSRVSKFMPTVQRSVQPVLQRSDSGSAAGMRLK